MTATPMNPILNPDLIREIEGVLTVNLGATILVASTSEPGEWHTVLPLSGACSCRGNVNHGHCKHVRIAATAQEQDRESAKPIPGLGKCRYVRNAVRCNHDAVDVWEWDDHHGSHSFGYCAEHMPQTVEAPTPHPTVSPENEEAFAKAMAYDPERMKQTGYALNN